MHAVRCEQATMAETNIISRKLNEISNVSAENTVAIRVPDPTNLLHLEAVILSPEWAPTANYIFFLDVKIPKEYPWNPPVITVKNKMWHPKIHPWRGGGICLGEIEPENWKPGSSLLTILLSIQMLLGDLGEVDASVVINQDALKEYMCNRQTFNKKALEWAKKDNEGYGIVQFEDYRLSAVQSVLAVRGIIPYECHVFCYTMSTQCFRLTLVIIPSLCIYREKMLPTSGSSRITQTQFQFKSSAMCLTTNDDSCDKCWTIKMSNSAFEKEKVDQFDPRKDPLPQCSITIEWVRPERPPHRLIHKFYIKDSKDDTEIKDFDVCIDPQQFSSGTETGKLTLPLLLKLPVGTDGYINLAEEVGDNFNFGVHLLNDTTGHKTRNIRKQESGSNVTTEILIQWLEGKGKPVTWESLVSVLRSIQLNTLATNVENAVHRL